MLPNKMANWGFMKADPVITSQDVVKAIDKFAQEYNVMPKKMRGSFMQLSTLTKSHGYDEYLGRYFYKIPLCTLEIELDINATEWYLA